MNHFFVAAGVIGTLGGCAHTVLGHLWTVAPLDPETIGSPQNSGDQNKRYLLWFWHIGSVLLLSTSLLLLAGGAGWVAVHEQVVTYISFLWLSITALFIVIALKPPAQIFRMVPGLVGLPVNALILAGIYF